MSIELHKEQPKAPAPLASTRGARLGWTRTTLALLVLALLVILVRRGGAP